MTSPTTWRSPGRPARSAPRRSRSSRPNARVPGSYDVVALAVGSSAASVIEQARRCAPTLVAVENERASARGGRSTARGRRRRRAGPGGRWRRRRANAVVGFAGLPATMAALSAGKRLAREQGEPDRRRSGGRQGARGGRRRDRARRLRALRDLPGAARRPGQRGLEDHPHRERWPVPRPLAGAGERHRRRRLAKHPTWTSVRRSPWTRPR